MAYRLSVAKPLERTIPAIVSEQIDEAIANLESIANNDKAVHAARRNFKRIRALLDLVKDESPGKTGKAGQKRFASIARKLAGARDAQIAYQAAAALEKKYGSAETAAVFADVKSWLQARRDRQEQRLGANAVDAVLVQLREVRADFDTFELQRTKIEDLLKAVRQTYRGGRAAKQIALESGEETAIHDWRKLVQRHWRHMVLFRNAWKAEIKARIALASELSDVLGTHHDLTVLRDAIIIDGTAVISQDGAQILCRFIEKKQRRLARKAAILGERLFAEKPKAFLKRLQMYWNSAAHANS